MILGRKLGGPRCRIRGVGIVVGIGQEKIARGELAKQLVDGIEDLAELNEGVAEGRPFQFQRKRSALFLDVRLENEPGGGLGVLDFGEAAFRDAPVLRCIAGNQRRDVIVFLGRRNQAGQGQGDELDPFRKGREKIFLGRKNSNMGMAGGKNWGKKGSTVGRMKFDPPFSISAYD